MMKPCPKCKKNDWSYVKLDNDPHIYCTCNRCGHKLSFLIPKKICPFCDRPTTWEHIDIDDDHRGKKCKLCGEVKVLEIAKATFIHGKLVPNR